MKNGGVKRLSKKNAAALWQKIDELNQRRMEGSRRMAEISVQHAWKQSSIEAFRQWEGKNDDKYLTPMMRGIINQAQGELDGCRLSYNKLVEAQLKKIEEQIKLYEGLKEDRALQDQQVGFVQRLANLFRYQHKLTLEQYDERIKSIEILNNEYKALVPKAPVMPRRQIAPNAKGLKGVKRQLGAATLLHSPAVPASPVSPVMPRRKERGRSI